MIIHSDWHMHSEASYDSNLPLEEIALAAEKFGFRKMGVTDHVNFNDQKFLADLKKSAESVNAFKKKFPNIVSGVELTPIAKAEFDYIAKTGTRDGYIPTGSMKNDGIELGQYIVPRLTTIRQPDAHIAERVVDILLKQISGKCKAIHEQTTFTLIKGNSTRRIVY